MHGNIWKYHIIISKYHSNWYNYLIYLVLYWQLFRVHPVFASCLRKFCHPKKMKTVAPTIETVAAPTTKRQDSQLGTTAANLKHLKDPTVVQWNGPHNFCCEGPKKNIPKKKRDVQHIELCTTCGFWCFLYRDFTQTDFQWHQLICPVPKGLDPAHWKWCRYRRSPAPVSRPSALSKMGPTKPLLNWTVCPYRKRLNKSTNQVITFKAYRSTTPPHFLWDPFMPPELPASYGSTPSGTSDQSILETSPLPPRSVPCQHTHAQRDAHLWFPIFPECVARVPVSLGGLGVRLCSPSFAFATATVRKCSQPPAVTP